MLCWRVQKTLQNEKFCLSNARWSAFIWTNWLFFTASCKHKNSGTWCIKNATVLLNATQMKYITSSAYPRNGGRQRALIFLDIFNEDNLGISKQCTPLLQDAGGFIKLHDLSQGANPPSPPRFSDDLSRLKAASDKTTLFLICLFWKNNKGAWIKNFFSANFFISNLLKIISVHRHNVQNVEFATSFRCILKR